MILGQRSPFRASQARRPGYVLIAVLIVIVVLSLAAYRFADSMVGEYRAGARVADAAQARAAAASGVHYFAALVADPESFLDSLGGDPTVDNPGVFSDVAVRSDPSNPAGGSRFSIVSVALVGSGQYEKRFAARDEGGKLNPNALMTQDPTGEALYNALLALPNMTPEIADAIVDWVDTDDVERAAGAENSYYQGLGEPYKAKNGPLSSVGELLLVRGVTPQLLYGTDQNQSGSSDRGWVDYVTVYGREVNVGTNGLLRVFINEGEPQAIYNALQEAGLGDEMAAYIMAALLFGTTALDADGNPSGTASGTTPPKVDNASLDQLITAVENKLSGSGTINLRAVNSLVDLINTRVQITAASTGGQGGQQSNAVVYYSPLFNNTNNQRDLLPLLLDRVTTKKDVELVPRLNVNTAPREVLLGLPGKQGSGNNLQWLMPALTPEEVDAVISARDSVEPGSLEATTGAWLLTSGALPADKYKAVQEFVTGSSMMYRIESVGYAGRSVARVEAVIDTNLGMPRIVYFRDLGDLDSPRAYPASSKQGN